jgi:hypothetical protein
VDDGANTLESRRKVRCSDVGDFDGLELRVVFEGFLQQRDFTPSCGSVKINSVSFFAPVRKVCIPSNGITCFKKLVHDLEAEISSGTGDLKAKLRKIENSNELMYARIQGASILWTCRL